MYIILRASLSKRLKIWNNNNVVILPGDTDSNVIIMDRSDYAKKVESMLQQGILVGKHLKFE